MKIFLTRDMKKSLSGSEYALWFVERGRMKQFFLDDEGHWGIDNKPGQSFDIVDEEESDGLAVFNALKSVIKSLKLTKGDIVEVKLTLFAVSMKRNGGNK